MCTRRVFIGVVLLARCLIVVASAEAIDWVRGGSDGTKPQWGVNGRLQFAIPPASVGPRGLVRVLYPALPGGKYDLINFIAIEPVVRGKRGYSEMERSAIDRVQGKRLSVDPEKIKGELSTSSDGVEVLKVVVKVEDFDNGARVRLVIEQRADQPDEIVMMLETRPESAPIEYGMLTATMGNKVRARLLWLKDETLNSLRMYAGHNGSDFANATQYPLKKLAKNSQGDLIVAITTDEANPASVHPFPGTDHWYYGGFPVTQYWKMTQSAWRDDVVAVVNARFMYWMSKQPLPGGIAFENFELRERYHEGQQFIFGITKQAPAELGFVRTATAPSAKP